MPESLSRSFDTVVVWAVAAALLFWPHFAPRWRTTLAVLTSAAGVFYLILAVSTEGLRETPTVSMFLMGRPYVTQRAEALASLPYYVMTGVCLLLGTAGLALPEARMERLRERWLAWAILLAVATTLLRFVLEKLAAPQGWAQAVGITWAAPVVGAFFLHNLRAEGKGLAALSAALLIYGFASRSAVAALMTAASVFRLGSHYDVTSLVRVVNPFTQRVAEFEPGTAQQIVSLGVLPQLAVWPFYTVLSGLIGAAVFSVLARLRPARPTRVNPPS